VLHESLYHANRIILVVSSNCLPKLAAALPFLSLNEIKGWFGPVGRRGTSRSFRGKAAARSNEKSEIVAILLRKLHQVDAEGFRGRRDELLKIDHVVLVFVCVLQEFFDLLLVHEVEAQI